MKLTIAVPCYNEARRLRLPDFSKFLAARDTRLLFVDDGSTDETVPVLRRFCLEHGELASLILLPHNCGKAEAVRQGVLAAAADSDCVGYWDADLATPLEAAAEFRGVLERRPQVQVVWGARLSMLGREIRRRPIRKVLGKVFSMASALTVAIPIHDALCGAKLFRTGPLVVDLFGEPFYSRWIFDVEILARLRALVPRNDAQLINSVLFEQPLDEWQEMDDSRLRIRDFLRAGLNLAPIFWQIQVRRESGRHASDVLREPIPPRQAA